MAEQRTLDAERAELLPCPFCGSKDVEAEGWESSSGKRGPACDDCGATAESIGDWNRRAPPALDAEELPSWIDDLKGQDPLMDDIIAYIIDLRAQLARQDELFTFLGASTPGQQWPPELARQSAPEGAPVGRDVMRALKGACDTAMSNTVAARVPECGDFGGIAQNLAWAIDEIERRAAPTSASAQPPEGVEHASHNKENSDE